MNKILKSLLSVAVIYASFASCTQVDTIADLEGVKESTTITLSKHSEWPITSTVVFATNTMGGYDAVFAFGEEKTLNVPAGQYKFYAVNKNNAYDYENLEVPGDYYYGNVAIACKTDEYTTTDEGLQKVLSGKYVKRNNGEIFADSTRLVEVLLGHKVNVTFQKPYKLTTQYTVSGSITSSRAAQSIYLEICDIIGKKRPNGAVVGGKKVKCVLPIGGAATDTKKVFEQSLTVLGVSKTGTANIYVRFKGDDTSVAPEMKSVSYTVVDSKDDNGENRRIIKLGDITF